MKEDYVTYEQAVKLRELGFDWKCTHYYEYEELTTHSAYSGVEEIQLDKLQYSLNKNCADIGVFDAPFLSMAQKWLRDVKGLSIRVSYIQYHKTWFSDWLNLETGEYDDTDATFDSYELALSAGIDAALRILENKVSCSASGKAD